MNTENEKSTNNQPVFFAPCHGDVDLCLSGDNPTLHTATLASALASHLQLATEQPEKTDRLRIFRFSFS